MHGDDDRHTDLDVSPTAAFTDGDYEHCYSQFNGRLEQVGHVESVDTVHAVSVMDEVDSDADAIRDDHCSDLDCLLPAAFRACLEVQRRPEQVGHVESVDIGTK